MKVNDTSSVRPDSYGSLPLPTKGVVILDAAFQTSARRLSSAIATPDDANAGRNLGWISPEYSVPASFNSDNSYLLLQHGSYFGLYRRDGETYAFMRNLPFEIHASAEPRWARKTSDLIYYVSGNSLKSWRVGTSSGTVVRQFSEYTRVYGRGKSDVCYDGDHMVLVGDGRFAFVFTLSTGAKSPVLDFEGRGFESVNVACPYNGVTVGWNGTGTSRFTGVELFGFDMKFQRQLCSSPGHMDLARDIDGKSYLVWTSSNDPAPRVVCENGIVKISLETGKQTCLLSLDWSLAVHISGSDVGYICVTTYGSPNTASWPAYANEILRIKLDGTRVERLTHHRSMPHNSYNWMPKASLSRDGSKIVFGSNWGMTYPEYADAYLIDLGNVAPTPIPTPTPVPTPIPIPTPTPAPDPLASRVQALEAQVKALSERLFKVLADLVKVGQ